MLTPSGSTRQGAAAGATDWYRDAVIYQLHVKSFFDGNDDGIGDFGGLLNKLDYIASLGVDTLWLLPFYPSPRRDDGYDVADYFGVSPDYGTLDDVIRFVQAAHERGLRVLGDLVLNHTSDAHPWFQRARHAPADSNERDFYVWSDSDQRYPGTRIIFPDVEKSNWTWDPVAGRYYFHRFYAHQPDLNYDNPQVLESMVQVMRYWLDLGFDGFRLDAVAYLIERDNTSNENLPETHAVLKRLRAEIEADYPDRVLLAEANQWPEDMQDYFGDDDECHMAFHFPLMPRMYMAVAQEDRFPITDILRQTPPTPPRAQWAIFLRNHDELTLEMVTDAERDYLWNTYAVDPRARINLGIRRRLAPLLERDRRRIELMTAMLLTLPGTPVLYYGDEIGMGDNIHLGDRDGVRTPMQWSVDRNGGFSRADTQRLVLPVLMDPLYGYPSVNVESQERDPHSLLHWTRRLLRVRRRYGGLFGRGETHFIYPRNRRVLVYLREAAGVHLLCVANLARTLQAVELDLGAFAGRVPIDAFGGASLPPVGRAPYLLTLPPYGFFLFELAGGDRLPEWHSPAIDPAPELATLMLRGDLATELQTQHRDRLDQELLRPWLDRCNPPRAVGGLHPTVVAAHGLGDPDQALLLLEGEGSTCIAAPLAVAWDGDADAVAATRHALARVRRGARIGVLAEIWNLPSALRALARGLEGHTTADVEHAHDCESRPDAASTVEVLSQSASSCSVLLDRAVLLTFARAWPGALDGPLQIARHLSRRDCPSALPLLGDRAISTDLPSPLVIAQAWPWALHDSAQTWTIEFLRRTLHEYRAASPEDRAEVLRAYLPLAGLLGSRLAQLHRTLLEEFGIVSVTDTARRAVVDSIVQHIGDCVETRSDLLTDAAAPSDPTPQAIMRRVRALGRAALKGADCDAIRVHGNVRLANIQLTADDLYFFDFTAPGGDIRVDDHGRALRLSDLADLLYSLTRATAALDPADEDADGTLAQFSADFRFLARRTVLLGYRKVWCGQRGNAPLGERAWLRLLQVRRAAADMLAARHAGSPGASWRLLLAAMTD